MADLLIRDVPDAVVAGIDSRAARLGLSRTEYLRRALAREAARSAEPVTVDDLGAFAAAFPDLVDDEVMRRAWE